MEKHGCGPFDFFAGAGLGGINDAGRGRELPTCLISQVMSLPKNYSFGMTSRKTPIHSGIPASRKPSIYFSACSEFLNLIVFLMAVRVIFGFSSSIFSIS